MSKPFDRARVRELAAEAFDRMDCSVRHVADNEACVARIEGAILQALTEALGAEPSEAMWGGLARDIIFWHDMENVRTPSSLFAFLGRIGREIPQWLRDEPELQNIYHAISKGTRAVIIYKAMAQALLAQIGGEG